MKTPFVPSAPAWLRLALPLLLAVGLFLFGASKTMAGAGTALPGGGVVWYDQYAQGFLNHDRGTIVARFDPVGRQERNEPFSFEFDGTVDSACGRGGEFVYFKSTLVPYEFEITDTTADGQFIGQAWSDSCGVYWYFVVKASLTNTTPPQVQQEPPGTCPVIVPQVNGCYYITREAMTPVGASALVKFWWCGPGEPTEPADCKDPFRLAAVAREGQVKMGKEVVLTTDAPPVPNVCGSIQTGDTSPPPIVECLAGLLGAGPIAIPDPRDCVVTAARASDFDPIPPCLRD